MRSSVFARAYRWPHVFSDGRVEKKEREREKRRVSLQDIIRVCYPTPVDTINGGTTHRDAAGTISRDY